MEVPEGGRGEAVDDPGIDVLVKVIDITAGLHVVDQTVALHVLLAEEDGQPLVVGDVLEGGYVDLAGLLEHTLIVPMRVQLLQTIGNLVVLAQQHDLNGGQSRILVESTVSSSIAHLVRGSRVTRGRGIGRRRRPLETSTHLSSQTTTTEGTDGSVLLHRVTVHVGQVQEGGDLSQLLRLVALRQVRTVHVLIGECAHKVDALGIWAGLQVMGISVGDLNRVAGHVLAVLGHEEVIVCATSCGVFH